LTDALYEIEVGKAKTKIMEQEAMQGIKHLLMTKYIQLLSLQDQLKFSEQSLASLENERNRAEIFYQLGLVSQKEIERIEREIISKTYEDQRLRLAYKKDLAKLCFEINVRYDPSLQLNTVELEEGKSVFKPESFNSLVVNSFAHRTASEEVRLAEYKNTQTDSNETDLKRQKEYAVHVAEEKLSALYQELEIKIDQHFYRLDEALLELRRAKEQEELYKQLKNELSVKFELGLISRYELEALELDHLRSKLQLNKAQLDLYLQRESIKLIQQGYIP
jgi:outer membrane protein TolC